MKIKQVLSGAAMIAAVMSSVHASTYVSKTFDEFVKKSAACVVGKVVAIDNSARSGFAVREVTFAVDKTVYGDAASEITIIIPGGVVPNTKYPLSQSVANGPSLLLDQEVMLVLDKSSTEQSFSVSGLANGVLHLRTINGDKYVNLRDGKGLTKLDKAIKIVKEMAE